MNWFAGKYDDGEHSSAVGKAACMFFAVCFTTHYQIEKWNVFSPNLEWKK